MNALPYQATFKPRTLRTRSTGINELEARLALDDNTRRDAFRLRYLSYSASGFIDKNDAGLFHDEFDAAPNAKTIVVYDQGVPVGAVRACFLSCSEESSSPARVAYPKEVTSLLANHRVGVSDICGLEVNRLVRSPTASNSQGLVFLLYRLIGYLALLENFQVVISCARRNHMAFYRRLGFKEAAEAKRYPGLKCAMHLLSCMRTDYDEVRRRVPVMNPSAEQEGSWEGFESGRAIKTRLIQTML